MAYLWAGGLPPAAQDMRRLMPSRGQAPGPQGLAIGERFRHDEGIMPYEETGCQPP